MASTYSNLGIELIGTGEQAGTWGVTTNSNFSNILDNAIVGYKAIAVTGTSSGSPTVLTVSDGSASDGQKRIIEATGSPASAGFLQISPNDFAGYYFIRNSTGQTLNVFQGTYSAGNAVAIENGFDAIIKCNGGGAGAVVSFINYNLKTGNISANGTVTATALSGPHNGTVGATTPSTGAFTTLSASSTVSGTGFSTYLASPPAIGGTTAAAITGTTITANTQFSGPHNGTVGATTPSTGAFTTLSASSTVSGTGFSTYLASPPAIGGTAAAAGSFTTLAASSTVSGTGFSTYLASPPAIGGTTASTVRGTTITATTAFSGPLNGTVGATTPSTGAFTTLSASSTVSGTGFSTYLASPPAIGGTTAAAGSFTSLSASGTVSGSSGSFGNLASSGTVSGTGFSTYLASPPAIGGTAAAAGSFTTLAASSTVSGTGFSTYLASPPAIGGTAAAAITGTTITATTAFSGPHNGTVGATTPSTGAFTTLAAGSSLVSGYTFSSDSGAALANSYFRCTDAGTSGMNITFAKDSASPAASDDIVNLRFYGNDSTSNLTEYVRLTATIADPTNASEDGSLSLFTIKASALAERVRYTSVDGLYVVDGAFRCPDAYAATTGTAANMVMTSASGILQRSTSSLRYKNSVADATYGLAEVMQLRPVTYKGNNDGDTVFGGFIAEEVHDIGLTQFVQYDAENRPDALAYGNMVSLLAKAMQEQQAVIEDLKARIAVLEAK